VTKPFGRQELLARVQALLRRSARGTANDRTDEVYDDGRLRIDPRGAEVRFDGALVALTPLEFRLLQALVRHPDQVLSRDQLLDLVWGDAAVSPDQVKLYVGYVRRKLPEAPIETVRGFGYRYARTPRE
jgi:DNA-binding response OmpR family regulator